MTASPDKNLKPTDGGVYQSPGSTDRLRERVLGQGLAWCDIDLAGARDKQSFLECCARSLQFPQTFGGNWDALADCLEDLAWLPAAGAVIRWRHGGGFVHSANDHAAALEIFAAAASYWKTRARVFVVLIDADGCGNNRFSMFARQ
ncbi:MAG: barnase inhibitor [Betaproteobacteria bacterium]|jgi:RNAse (barnase) inhibitor barstar|nr:barnase inhibitor [Betaproteobacteria bacterium]